jgi:hypothetical protein
MSLIEVGKTVAYIPFSTKNFRNAEGCFIRMKDNSILYAFSNYYGDWEGCKPDDCCPSDIGYLRSYDEGETWPERGILYGEAKENYMDPWLVRMDNGDLGLVFIHHPGAREAYFDDSYFHQGKAFFVRSSDEGKTWSKPILVSNPDEGVCFICDHGIRLQSGRILLPMALHPYERGSYGGLSGYGTVTFFYSDDDGATWQEFPGRRLVGPSREWSDSGLQEPFPYQTEDGTIRVFCRTDLGCHYETVSHDDGMTWSEPMPNKNFTGCCAPMVWRKSGKYTVAVFNPIPDFIGREYMLPHLTDQRNPLILYISEDDGKTFNNLKCIDSRMGPQYPSIFDGGDYILVGYELIEDCIIKKIHHSEFHKTVTLPSGSVIV